MILCVTPNTALDRALVVPGYSAGGVFRPQQVVALAGGKGVNVARVIRLLGGQARALGFIAGHVGALAAAAASAEGLDCDWTALSSGETRICTILVDPALGQTSVVNEAGAETSADDWARLRDTLLASPPEASTVCFCGSLPPGASLAAFPALLEDLRAAGRDVWVDSSGAPLRAATEIAGVHIKINDEEAAALLNMPIHTLQDAAQAAQALAARLGASAVITLGARGALLSDGVTTFHAVPPSIEVKSAVGSGDSFFAALLLALEQGQTPAEALRSGVAAGAANALSVGGGQFALGDYERLFEGTRVAAISGEKRSDE